MTTDINKLADEIQDSLERRRKNFRIEIAHDYGAGFLPNGFRISITANGYQYQSFHLLPEEVEAVVKALRQAKKGEYTT